MRTIVTASLVAALTCTGIAFADDTIDKAAKKIEQGFGELLKGMGQ